MDKKESNVKPILFWFVLVIAGATSAVAGLFPGLFTHRLVGRQVVPGFVPDEVAAIQIDGTTVVEKADGHWRIPPYDGYPADDDLVMRNLRDVSTMTVCSVVRSAKRRRAAMSPRHCVAFLNGDGGVLGEIVLGNFHLDVHEGFVDTIVKRDGRYLEMDNEVVLVKPVLAPFSGRGSGWITAKVFMMPDNLYYMHMRNRDQPDGYEPVVSIDYEFDGARFRMERNSDGKLALVNSSGLDGLNDMDRTIFWKQSYRFSIAFQNIESLDNFKTRHPVDRMSSGRFTVCTSDGMNTYTRTATLYRGDDSSGYIALDGWV